MAGPCPSQGERRNMKSRGYEIQIHELAAGEMEKLRAYDQRRVLDAIERHLEPIPKLPKSRRLRKFPGFWDTLLSDQPLVPTRRRKCLESFTPRFEHVPPIWELRVGSFRVFYDADEANKEVHVRAVRHKGQTKTTEDVA